MSSALDNKRTNTKITGKYNLEQTSIRERQDIIIPQLVIQDILATLRTGDWKHTGAEFTGNWKEQTSTY